MEWYFGGENITKDQERLECSLQQGPRTSEKCGLPSKCCIQAEESTTNELSFSRESFIYELNEDQSHGWTAWGEFPFADWHGGNREASLQRNGPLSDQMDYQLDGLNETNRIDDIFLRPMLEDPMDMQNQYPTVGIVPESECSRVSFDNLSTDMVTESQSLLMEPTDLDILGYFRNCGFSQSEVWENLEDDTPHITIPDSGQKKCSMTTKASILMVKPTDELYTSHEEDKPLEKETSLEVRVLRELEVVMTKIPQNTRICFRDALYRLAKCSKQNCRQSAEIPNKDLPLTIHREALRSGRGQPMGLKTNAIDHTIANLMFNTLNCYQTDLILLSHP